MIENDKNQKDKINEELINTYEISYIFENKPLNRLKTKPTLEKKSDRLDQLKSKIEEIDDCELKSNAKSENLTLITTEKDFFRLNKLERKNIKFLKVKLEISNLNYFKKILINQL